MRTILKRRELPDKQCMVHFFWMELHRHTSSTCPQKSAFLLGNTFIGFQDENPPDIYPPEKNFCVSFFKNFHGFSSA